MAFNSSQRKTITKGVLVSFIFLVYVSVIPAPLVAVHSESSQSESPGKKSSTNYGEKNKVIEKEIPQAKHKRRHSLWPFIIGGVAVTAVVLVLLLKKKSNDNKGPITTTGWGKRGSESGQFNGIQDIAVDRDGYVYVSEVINKRIQKFTQNGVFVKEWYGPSPVSFSPGGMTVSKKILYVCNMDQILLFNLNGNFISNWSISDPNPNDNQKVSLVDITVDESKSVYITDSGNHRILQYTIYGELIRTWGTGPGNLPDELNYPTGITTINNEVLVTDSGNRRFIVYDTQGNRLRSWMWQDSTSHPGGMVAWGKTHVLISYLKPTALGHMMGGGICKYDLNGAYLGNINVGSASPKGLDVNYQKQKVYSVNYYENVGVFDPI